LIVVGRRRFLERRFRMGVTDCVFCQIVAGDLDAEVVHNEEEILAFRDINGRAPVHVLVIPKRHVANLEGIGDLSGEIAKRLFEVASLAAGKLGVVESGYAVRINNGHDAGQEIPHLHLHVIGGERLGMP
jgi:histidine triad (HIT) family protein